MKPNAAAAVGDVEERQDDWSFTVVNADQKASICFVFRGRKEATVSRRLMKEILARSIAMSVADLPDGQNVDGVAPTRGPRDELHNRDAGYPP